MTTRYRSNHPRFVDETVDDEALIMDMVRGTYYSCTGASTTAWNALATGNDIATVVAHIATGYEITTERAAADLDAFVAALLAEGMLVEAPEANGADAALPAPVVGVPYAPLAFERFTDLADLILLDPVHDVGDAGWPHVAE